MSTNPYGKWWQQDNDDDDLVILNDPDTDDEQDAAESEESIRYRLADEERAAWGAVEDTVTGAIASGMLGGKLLQQIRQWGEKWHRLREVAELQDDAKPEIE